jgi:putative Mg2+ transporter-C (MgtC) family protein
MIFQRRGDCATLRRAMVPPLADVALNLAAGWGAGTLIGAERSYNGRAAGLRTHSLVGLAAAGAMITAMGAPTLTLTAFPAGDATRIAQGVLTGVGFLGAGVIFKEGVSVQGLTTAACIWATAVIGLLFGSGLFWPGVMATLAVLTTLVLFRALEGVLPVPAYAVGVFRFDVARAPGEDALRRILASHHVSLFDLSVGRTDGGAMAEYRGNLRIRRPDRLSDLADHIGGMPGLVEFDLARIGK